MASLPETLVKAAYERTRASSGGVGAARLGAGGKCEACHLTLSRVDVDQIKKAGRRQVVLCQCGRILVLSVLVWFAAGSVAIVWWVFQAHAVDYRMVMVGSLLALAEVPFGVGPLQTLAASVVALAVVMGVTVGRRLVRHR